MRHRLPRLLLASAIASLIFAAGASAETFTDRASLKRHGRVVFGHPISAKVNFHARFASISRVCFFFTFRDDLLDPGEEWFLRFRANVGGFGLLNTSENAVIGISLCLAPAHNLMIARFLDGREKMVLTMQRPGSMRIGKLKVSIDGVRK
jgi:hypothetical protein